MFSRAEIIELAAQLGLNRPTDIQDFETPINQLALDSLDLMRLISEIEKEAGKNLTADQFRNLASLKDLFTLFDNQSED